MTMIRITNPTAAAAFTVWKQRRAKQAKARLAAAHRRDLTAVSRYLHRADAVRYMGRLQP